MKTVEIPRKAWGNAFNEFTRMHEGWRVSIDILGGEIGAQHEVQELPLVGVTAEPGDGGTIAIAVARSGSDHLTHSVHAVTHVWIERTDEGADAALEIESADGTKTILRFRTPALPETVDGIVRPSVL